MNDCFAPANCGGRRVSTMGSVGERPLASAIGSMAVSPLSAQFNARAVQILLGHTKIENTVPYLGVDVEDMLSLAEATEI